MGKIGEEGDKVQIANCKTSQSEECKYNTQNITNNIFIW